MDLQLGTPIVSDKSLLHSFTSAANAQYRFLVTNNDNSKVIGVWNKGKTVGIASNKMGVPYTDVTLAPGNYDVSVDTTEMYTIVVTKRDWWRKVFGAFFKLIGFDVGDK